MKKVNHLLQIPLDLGHRNALGRDDFLVSPSNQDAVAWIDLWPEWPAPALVLYGPPACGKTHLAAVWGQRAKATSVDLKVLNDSSVREIAAQSEHLVVEDADVLIGNVEGEKGLFHLYNVLKEHRRTMLMTLEQPPVRRAFALPDLASRLRAAPCVAIREPDETLLSAILVKLFNDRQVRVDEAIIHYILMHMERSFEAARKIVDLADKAALKEKRPVSLPLLKEILTN